MEPVSDIRHSPLEGRRPKRTELAGFVDGTVDDIRCPHPTLLIVGINPGLWTAAVNAPFAYPGNRFWPSLFASGLTPWQVDASYGLHLRDERMMIDRGIGLTNLVNRATAKASELNTAELRQGADRLRELCARIHPRVIAILGITAYRQAFADKSASLGLQRAAVGDAPAQRVERARHHAGAGRLVAQGRRRGRSGSRRRALVSHAVTSLSNSGSPQRGEPELLNEVTARNTSEDAQ